MPDTRTGAAIVPHAPGPHRDRAAHANHDRDPLSASRLLGTLGTAGSAARLAGAGGAGGLWSDIRVVAATGSTNADVLAEAASGAPEGLVIAAEAQTAGRGRQGRSWISRPGAALTFSVLLRPAGIPPAVRGWVPLLVGVATATALRAMSATDIRLKWPNDILIGEGKLAGILAEQVGDAIVVGVGVNILGGEQDLPVPTATSLAVHGAGQIDRTGLLAEILRQLERWYLAWRDTCSADADACGLRQEYERLSATIGRQVRVQLPGGRLLAGRAIGVDDMGRLLVRSQGGDVVPISAGDVVHVR